MNNTNHIKEQLKEAFKTELPGSASHHKMLPPERELTYSHEERKHVKKSSVLILIYPDGNELFTCLMKRPHTMKHHPGQISFPGGQIESNDKDEIYAALREANEELGLIPDSIEIIGKLSKLYVNVSQFEIYPVVAFINQKPELQINKNEVEKTYFLPLREQLKENKFPLTKIETSRGIFNVPCIFFDNEIIWGATAMILAELLDVLKKISVKPE